MPVIALETLGGEAAPSLETCDVCIIGSGPAGSTVARELSNTGLRVTLLESGGFERQAEADSLNEIESVGRPRVIDQWLVRNRIVGGSSHTWTGRCAPFDEIDFEDRSWVPNSGWPIRRDELEPYFDRAAPYLGLSGAKGFSDDRFWEIARRARPQSQPDTSKLLPFFWQFSRDETNPYDYMRIGPRLAAHLGPNVTLVTNATVVAINPDESGRAVRTVEFVDPGGRRRRTWAGAVVLCAGGVENARLLLVSNNVIPEGLGNRYDLVGRYLMDHPRGSVGSFNLAHSDNLQKRFGLYNVGGVLFRAGLRLSPQVQRSEELLNCAAWLGEEVTDDDPWHSVKRLLRGKARLPSDLLAIALNAGLFARGIRDYFVDRNGLPRKLDALTLDCMCEQRPDRDSRVTLSSRRDKFGVPLSKIDWRVSEDEGRSVRRMAELAKAELHRMGYPELELAEWVKDGAGLPASFVDVAHPTGSTRMSQDRSTGVVDTNLQVHGLKGLYVAGSSVFPTAGHCNPTHMIVAMALRLADHLKRVVTTDSTAAPRKAREMSGTIETQLSDSGRPLVLVTGATGRIGRFVVDDLVERGYSVRATTSRTPLPADDEDRSVEWRCMDLRATGAGLDHLLHGVSAVVHLAAEMTNPENMDAVNVVGTRALADAAERVGVKVFVYASSVAVYGSGLNRVLTEDAPVLTADHDIRSEYWASDQLRAYGRSKLGGEIGIRHIASAVRYVIFRPTVVVDIDDVVAIREWSAAKRWLAAHRHAHHIYVRDVADAISWAVEGGLEGRGMPGAVETYNLGEDEFSDATHASFLKKAYSATKDKAFHVVPVAWVADWLQDALKARSLPLRNPLGRMRFPSDRLHAAGWRPRFGMANVHRAALERLGA